MRRRPEEWLLGISDAARRFPGRAKRRPVYSRFRRGESGLLFHRGASLDDLVGGSTVWPSVGDPREFGLPDDLSEWDFVHR
jgi:hypothetical protein